MTFKGIFLYTPKIRAMYLSEFTKETEMIKRIYKELIRVVYIL